MDEIAALLDRMRELEPETYVYGPASESVTRELEAAFGRPMPPSYRAFLARFGAVNVVNTSFSGIIDGEIHKCRGCTWTDTLLARAWCQLPEHYLVVEPGSDGFVCLDFSRTMPDGEHPVVDHFPFKKTPFHDYRQSYGRWLTESLQAMIGAWSDAED